MENQIGLYKAKRIDNNEWVQGYHFKAYNDFDDEEAKLQSFIIEPSIFVLRAGNMMDKDRLSIVDFTEVHADSVLPWTGKLYEDAPSLKIFQGDVLKLEKSVWPAFQHTQAYAEVIWWAYKASFYLREFIIPENPNGRILTGMDRYGSSKIEVIGNIIDNPKYKSKD